MVVDGIVSRHDARRLGFHLALSSCTPAASSVSPMPAARELAAGAKRAALAAAGTWAAPSGGTPGIPRKGLARNQDLAATSATPQLFVHASHSRATPPLPYAAAAAWHIRAMRLANYLVRMQRSSRRPRAGLRAGAAGTSSAGWSSSSDGWRAQ